MKKYYLFSLLVAATVIFSYCNPAKKAAGSAEAKLTYETDITALIATNCTPCHIPEKGGNKKAYNNYANVKADIDEMIRRIELNPGERGFMPFKKKEKLSDSTVNVFKKWRNQGLTEK